MFKIDGKLNGANLMTKYMGKETLETDMASCGLVALTGRHSDTLKLEVDLESMSKGSVLLVLTLGCLPRLANAGDTCVALKPDATDSSAFAYCLVALLVLIFGCCCCWAGAEPRRRFGDRAELRSVGTMTEDATRRAPQSIWTAVQAGGLPGTGVFHGDEHCGGLSGAHAIKFWRRCLRPECRGRLT